MLGLVAVAVAVIIVVRRSGGPGEPVEPSLSGSRVYRRVRVRVSVRVSYVCCGYVSGWIYVCVRT